MFTFNLKQMLSLSQWNQRLLMRKVVSLLMVLCFLSPSLSWAFSLESYLYPDRPWLKDAAGQALASAFEIPQRVGEITAASAGPAGSMTFVLLQDLHCNAEIQANIRASLEILLSRHKDLRLIAEEGATGIVPLLEMANLPDSPEKRAVTEYFVRQGKINGQVWYVTNGHPQTELFGAEDAALYNQSLKLFREFSTEENNGLLLELFDNLDAMAEKTCNRNLLAFERRKKIFQNNALDSAEYFQALLRDARQLKIAQPAELFSKTPDTYTRTQQQNYLEQEIEKRLAITPEEKKLAGFRRYLEMGERVLNISASRENLLEYQQLAKTISMEKIVAAFSLSTAVRFPNTKEDAAQLERALQKGLQFYQLADQRDWALVRNAMLRAQSRHENKVVLVTGGYHTRSIQDLIAKSGQSYITIQPAMTRVETNNPYFDLLRDPGRPTDLENLIAQARGKISALAVQDPAASGRFRQAFAYAVSWARLSAQILRGRQAGAVRNLSFQRMEIQGISFVMVTTPQMTYYVSLDGGHLFIGRSVNELAQAAGQERTQVQQVFSQPTARIGALAMMGFGAILLATPLLPLGVAMIIGGFLGLVANLLTSFTSVKPQTVRKVAIFGSILLAALFLVSFSGSMLADVFNYFALNNSVPYPILDTTVNALKLSFDTVLSPLGLHVYQHDPALAKKGIKTALAMVGILFPVAGQASSRLAESGTGQTDTTLEYLEAVHAADNTRKLTLKHGRPIILPEDDRDLPAGTFNFFPLSKLRGMMNILVQLGWRHSDDLFPKNVPANKIQPLVRTYAQTQLIKPGAHLDNLPISVRIEKLPVPTGGTQFQANLNIICPQFFGGANFTSQDFQYHEIVPVLRSVFSEEQAAQVVFRRIVTQMGIPALAQQRRMSELAVFNELARDRAAFVTRFTDAANACLGTPELINSLNDFTVYALPEAAKIALNARKRLNAKQTAPDWELRQINRALIELSFPSKSRRPSRVDGLPNEWRRGALSQFSDFAMAVVLGPELGLKRTGLNFTVVDGGLLDILGDDRQKYADAIIANAKADVSRNPNLPVILQNNLITAQDIEQLDYAVLFTFLHEENHLVAVHVPDQALPRVEQKELERQKAFNIDTLSGLYSYDPQKDSEAKKRLFYDFCKSSLFKGLRSAAATRNKDDALNMARLEYYNNRFAIWEAENAAKLRVYQNAIVALGAAYANQVPKTILDMFELEKIPTGTLQQRFPGINLAALAANLQATAREHPLVAFFNSPELLPEERLVYFANWQLAHHHFTQDKFGVVVNAHLGSRFVSRTERIDESFSHVVVDGATRAVDLMAEGASPVAAVSIAAGEAALDLESPASEIELDQDDTQTPTPSAPYAAQIDEAMNLPQVGATPTGVLNSLTELGEDAAGLTVDNPQHSQSSGIVTGHADVAEGSFDLSDLVAEQPEEPVSEPVLAAVPADTAVQVAHTAALQPAAANTNAVNVNVAIGHLAEVNPNLTETTSVQVANMTPAGAPATRASVPMESGAGYTGRPFGNGNAASGRGAFNLSAGDTGLPGNLAVSADAREAGLAPGRITYLMDACINALAVAPAGQNIILGFDSPALAQNAQDILNAAAASKPSLAQHVQIVVFPAAANGTRPVPANWNRAEGVAVLSSQGSLMPVQTIVVGPNHQMSIATSVASLSQDEARKAFGSNPQLLQQLEQNHQALLSTMRNQSELNGRLLLSQASINLIQANQPAILSNLVSNVVGFQAVASSAAAAHLPIAAIEAAAAPALAAGAASVALHFSVEAYQSAVAAAANATAVIQFGMDGVLTSSNALVDEAAFVRTAGLGNVLHSGPLQSVAAANDLTALHNVDTSKLQAASTAAVRADIAHQLGSQAASQVTDEAATAITDRLAGLDQVTATVRGETPLAQSLAMLYGTPLAPQRSIHAATTPAFALAGGRPAAAQPHVSKINPLRQSDPAAEQPRAGRFNRIVSSLLLGIAAGILVLRVFSGMIRARTSSGQSAFLLVVTRNLPALIRGLSRMVLVVMAQEFSSGAFSAVAQANRTNMLALLAEMTAHRGWNNISQVEPNLIANAELRYFAKNQLPRLVALQHLLTDHPTFRQMIQNFAGTTDLTPMLPELSLLNDASGDLSMLMYPYAPVAAIQLAEANLQLPEELSATLHMSSDEARQKMQTVQAQMLQTTDPVQLAALKQQASDCRTALLWNKAMGDLHSAVSPRHEHNAIRALLHALDNKNLDHQAAVLGLLSAITPLEQTTVQVRQLDGRILVLSVPDVLYNSGLRDVLLSTVAGDVFDLDGKPIQKLHGDRLRAGAAA